MPSPGAMFLLLVRLVVGVLGAVLACYGVAFLLQALGVSQTDNDEVVLLAIAVVCLVPAAALLWGAAAGRFGVWSDRS